MNAAELRRVVLVAALALGACDRSGDRVSGDAPQRAPVADTLLGEILYAGDELGRPQSLGVVRDWVLVGDVPRPHALHVIGRADGRHLASWGREGKGPGEFTRLWGIQPAESERQAWLYDPSQSRLTRVDVEALASGNGEPLLGSINLTADIAPMSALRLGDSLVVTTGLFSGGRFAHFDGTGRIRGMAGPLPPAPSGIPAAVAQHAYTGTLVVHPRGDLLAVLTRHADRVEIYTPGGEAVRVGRGPRAFEPVYEMQVRGGTPVMTSGEDLRFGYVDASVARDHIYALYSGFTRGQLPGRANFGGEVHVFDWEGRLHRILPLDHRALGLAVSPDEQTLYTIVHLPVPAVLRYDLPREGR